MPDVQGAVPLGQNPPAAPPQEQEPQEIEYPPGLPKSHYTRFRQYRALQAENGRSETELKQRYGAGISAASVVGLRLQILLDMIWPQGTADGERARLELDMRYQEGLAGQWENLRRQAVQARLAAGANLSPDELAVVQRAQRQQSPGLFGG